MDWQNFPKSRKAIRIKQPGKAIRLRLAVGPAVRSVYLRGSIQPLPICFCLLILLTVIDDQGSVHIKKTKIPDPLHICFPAPKQSYALSSVSCFG